GTYLYIDRAMGPRLGTIAGIGAWFSLTFKSAFALVGLGAYLLLFTSIPPKPVALGLAVLLVAVNVIGVKQTGRLQAAIVTLVVAMLALFVADGITFIETARYHPFFPHGSSGLVAAAGFVFVSYAGVTKIASVAEEVENPARNIPVGILGSVVVMMLIYTLVVLVVVGVAPPAELATTLTPMAVAAEAFLGLPGQVLIVAVAVLALTSMANAGILASSRYPLALARDELAPSSFGGVNERFRTPTISIGVTGVLLVLLIGTVPVIELAKLASAFKILVFGLNNAALIAFRESELDWYDPDFIAPGYPWVQIGGILGGLVLLTQMGTLSMLGAVGIVVVGAAWYRIYGRERTEREGAALDALRRTSTDRALERTREACAAPLDQEVLIPVGGEPDAQRATRLIRLVHLASDLTGAEGRIRVVHFEEVPEQLSLSRAAVEQLPEDVEFEEDTGRVASGIDAPVEFAEVVTHDAKRAVTNFADHYEVDLILGEWHPSRFRGELLGADVDWYMAHTPCDVIFVRERGYDEVGEITVVADRGPFDPLEVVAANAVAKAQGATIRFVTVLDETAPSEKVDSATAYLDSLAQFCTARTTIDVRTAPNRIDAIAEAARGSGLVLIGTSAHHLLYNVIFGSVPDRLVEKLDMTVALAHSRKPRRHTFLRAVLDRFIF
ncbi:MAG: amino acid permease, partial [Halobacteriales archaeon]|nr:amino acid permease [Halobacteriales archaeon]